jgi:hypothetical protein
MSATLPRETTNAYRGLFETAGIQGCYRDCRIPRPRAYPITMLCQSKHAVFIR